MEPRDTFYGPNAAYAQELYERYLTNPESVDGTTRAYFERHGPPEVGLDRASPVPSSATTQTRSVDVRKIVTAARLARSIREYGHLAATVSSLLGPGPGDPMLDMATHGLSRADLEALPATIVWPDAGPGAGTCWDAIEKLRAIYSGPLGYEFDHIESYEERNWLHEQVEAPARPRLTPKQRKSLLERLSRVEGFERYLHTAFPGQKRFSLEGNDMLVPMLDFLIQRAMESGTREVLIGMSHRGRLNVLAHVLGKPYAAILGQFQAAGAQALGHGGEAEMVTTPGWSGDVKYHLGGRRTLNGEAVSAEVTLADNPSHLEFVDPVVEGFARAAQDERAHAGPPEQHVDRALAVLAHGDAAFPGEGIVAETLNLSGLPGYTTGGTVHFIVNNLIGFTTAAEEGRSTLYASDIAKGFGIPIIHVNADNPEACLWAVELAFAFRHQFHKDAIIDLVGYRRWGHNEGDNPAFTQPGLYGQIERHPTVRQLYAEELQKKGIIADGAADSLMSEVRTELQRAREDAQSGPVDVAVPEDSAQELQDIVTAVPERELRAIHEALLDFPEDFELNPTLRRVLDRRRRALDTPNAIDWSLGETLALGTILADGVPIRLTGQDTGRGTFSQRHAVLTDPATGAQLIPLQALPQARASLALYNSPLTEAATMGFEYGYSVHAPDVLDLWEAQFGDFSNVGQVIIDQFIASGRAKWQARPALVLLLPHGYEGQGSEHSSARLERYLQLAAEDNIRVANCTTPAQYFHLLRVQAATLTGDRRPLVLMTPKSLLRHPLAASSREDLTDGHFHPVLNDSRTLDHPDEVARIILCSGKIGVDLLAAAAKSPADAERVAVVRVELLYPFPGRDIREVMELYRHARDIVWLQEEPLNMGAWRFVEPLLRDILPEERRLRYIGRPDRAAPAEGSAAAHQVTQQRLIDDAFSLEGAADAEERAAVKGAV
ncbi:MAG TPA: 2-oxoglutarate dehydrogenase E1 component [Chloroflexota bacterium]|nr:2-oxoglutarate dehydrogenase E1 component [Chloroflexota bacterium]